MYLTEKHIIKKSHPFYVECDGLAFKSKNLYNAANYIVRNHFIITGHYLNYFSINSLFVASHLTYLSLPAKVSQQTLRQLNQDWNSYFASLKSWKRKPSAWNGKPRMPKYKDPKKGRQVVIYDAQAIYGNKKLRKKGILKLSGTNIEISSKQKNIKQVRIIPGNQQYIIEVVYEKRRKLAKLDKKNIVSIDLGLNNLCTITSNKINPKIINGKPLKSINQFYNKELARLQECLPKNKFNSNRITKLTNKRNNKVQNYLHNVSRFIINDCLANNVGTLVIGYNPGWKDEINLGRRTNQNFVQIPFLRLIDQLKYKADLIGMKVAVREESYTSKCSLLDNEPIKKHTKYLGRRIKRGLFRSSDGRLINSDVNGSGNILRKAFPRVKSEGIEGLSVNPLRVTPQEFKVVPENTVGFASAP